MVNYIKSQFISPAYDADGRGNRVKSDCSVRRRWIANLMNLWIEELGEFEFYVSLFSDQSMKVGI